MAEIEPQRTAVSGSRGAGNTVVIAREIGAAGLPGKGAAVPLAMHSGTLAPPSAPRPAAARGVAATCVGLIRAWVRISGNAAVESHGSRFMPEEGGAHEVR